MTISDEPMTTSLEVESSSWLPRRDLATDQMFLWGMEQAPKEACGVLVIRGTLHRAFRLPNHAENPRSRYEISKQDLLAVLRDDHQRRDELVFWHTHPGGLVGPSDADKDSRVEGIRYLVVTIPTGEVTWF